MSGSILSGGYLEKPICINKSVVDMGLMVIFPPLWVLIKELKTKPKKRQFKRVIICFILTGLFYFPGLLYSINIMNNDGGIN